MKFVRCISNKGNEASLDLGFIYRALELNPLEKESGMVRIIDNEGEDYLYPNHWFETLSTEKLLSEPLQPLTIYLNAVSRIAVRDQANAEGVSISGLVREWIDERLDLPQVA